ncbi:hypothetical protein FO519_003031 [Halicephalobus sp. NKZ332]|nr:hypothetical protein FO519_003031 [Halicephalobus sp. NKZ332]
MPFVPAFTVAMRTVIFFSMILGASFSFVSGLLFIYLFWKFVISKNKSIVEVQSALVFYKSFEIVNAVVVFVHLTHASTLYRLQDDDIYATVLFFWDGGFHNITSVLRPIAIFVLGLDRICIIAFATRPTWRRKNLSIFIGVVLMIVSTVLLFIYRIMPNVPEKELFYCPNFSCLTQYGNPSIYITLRMVFGSANLVVGMLLLMLILKMISIPKTHGNCNPKTNINLVFFILLLTFLLDFLPHIIGFIFQAITNTSLATYLGPYSTVITALEMSERRRIAKEAVVKYNEDRLNFRKELGLPSEVPSCHPLKYEWTFWSLKGDRKRSWEECLSQIITVDTVEGFFTVVNRLIPPSTMIMGSDFYIFRRGIKPMWEDKNNIRGGRWSFIINRQKRGELLDQSWLELAMAVTSAVRFRKDLGEICGAAVNVRYKGDKVTLWTRDASNDDANYRIGQIMFQILQLDEENDVIYYEAHRDSSARTGSMVKPRLVLPGSCMKNINLVSIEKM